MPRKKKPENSASTLVDLYLDWKESGEEEDDLYDLFEDGLSHYLNQKGFWEGFMADAADLLDTEDLAGFIQECERIAGQMYVSIGDQIGYLQLFVIPIHGSLDAIEEMSRNTDRISDIARSLRATGYVAQSSSVVVRSEPIPLPAMAMMNPEKIREILVDISAPLSTQPGSSVFDDFVHDVLKGIRKTGSGDEDVHGVRFLVGARVSLFDDLQDGLLPGLTETDKDACIREDSWDMRMRDILGDEPRLLIDEPIAWCEARSELLACALRHAAAVTISLDRSGEVSPDEDINHIMILGQECLEVKLIRKGRVLTSMSFGLDIIGPELPIFIEHIEAEYPRLEDFSSLDLVTVH